MISGNLYHIYNRGNNSQKIFFEEGNYRFFTEKIRKHLLPFSDILAYCLMPNHFHLLIVAKPSNPSDGSKPSDGCGSKPSDGLEVNKAIGIILRSYTQAINKRFNRTGSLFQQKTFFKPIDSDVYARTVFHYIHQNPLKAGLVKNMEHWLHSSFKDYLSNGSESLCNKNLAYELIDFPLDANNFYRTSYEVIKSVDLIELEKYVATFKNQLKTIGLTLSGGGARGIAHLGVIKALEELGVEINYLSGTSSGAIIAGLYAYGHKTDEILKILMDIKTFKFLQPAMSKKGLLKMEVMSNLLKKHMPEATFESLKTPTYIAATNVRLGETKYFTEGDLISAICASSCIPVLFNPVEIDGELYVDGGILNNLPIEPIREKVDVLIASHSNPIDTDFIPKNFRFVMERSLMLAITQNVYERKPNCDIFIEPRGLETFKVMDLNKAKEIYQIGYDGAVRQLKEQKLLELI